MGNDSSRFLSFGQIIFSVFILLMVLSACSHWQEAGRPTSFADSSSASIDTDNDGIPDSIDNCPQVANSDQTDLNGDGFGDRCDDLDGDRILDFADQWPLDPEDDIDHDGFGADPYDNCGYICDHCERLAEICRQVDNCPYQANDQADSDQDGFGDLCDTGSAPNRRPATRTSAHGCTPAGRCQGEKDEDHDKVPDSEDNCLGLKNPYDVDTDGDGKPDAQLNTDNDAFGDPCDDDDDNDGILIRTTIARSSTIPFRGFGLRRSGDACEVTGMATGTAMPTKSSSTAHRRPMRTATVTAYPMVP